jgi:methyl-accepting chemotaxis protein
MNLSTPWLAVRRRLFSPRTPHGSWMNRLRIGTRLALAFSALLALAAGLGLFAIAQLQVVRQSSTEISSRWMAGVRLSSQMNTDASDFRIAEAKHLLAADADERANFERELNGVAAALAAHAAEYEALLRTAEDRKLYDAFKRERQRYLDEHGRLMRLSRSGETEDAKAMLTYNSQKKYEGAAAALRALVDRNIDGGREAAASSEATFAAARRWILALLAGAIVLGGALSWVIARSIGRPLKAAVGVAGAVAGGDLTVAVPRGGRDETGQLLAALQAMTASLDKLVAEVRQGSEQVAMSAQEIALGNTDLSQRTEQQAARLQQLASSTVQLRAAVQAIDESAARAAKVADGVSGLATTGSGVMARVVTTMRSILNSSQRIGEITGVIDTIAFKTNILALNAAVEAARAGDAGRGFGVVAGEVRALAQVSAQAARDIKALIDESQQRVDSGSTLVGEAGSAMDEILAQVRGVHGLIARISEATGAQSGDIAAVCDTIAQLDQATQQNAALVEQSAAASESLREQAQQLVGAVSVFRTRQG